MIAAAFLALFAAGVALGIAVARKSREQDAATAAILNAEWDAWAEPLRTDTPIYAALAAETFRRQLDEGRQG